MHDALVFSSIANIDKYDSDAYHSHLYPDGKFSKKAFLRYSNPLYNRCKIFMKESSSKPDPKVDSIPWMPPCSCYILKDTLLVIMSNGIMMDAYTGLAIKIYKDTFSFNYYEVVTPGSWSRRFANNDTDSVTNTSLSPANRYQFLLLKNKPSIKTAKNLTGYLSFTTDDFFELKEKGVVKQHLSGSLLFTCKTKAYPSSKKVTGHL
ncbi:MAG: hypothetical protein ABIY62_08690 [Ginsengibacter sp.]